MNSCRLHSLAAIILILFTAMIARAQTSPHGSISIACQSCHTENSWTELRSPMLFNHDSTGFSLVGKHAGVQCIECHAGMKFEKTPTDCYTCHATEFAAVLLPNHQTGQFSHDCTTCHSMNGWRYSTFDHAKTNYQLVGAHTTLDCASCHTQGKFAGLPSDCFSCHASNFASVMTPSHTAGKFSHDCTACHTSSAWQPSTFDHAKTIFPLTGAHGSVQCAECHKNGQFAGTPTNCYSCHENDFAGTTDPNHVAQGFSHDCTGCHTTTSWGNGQFNHSSTGFVLTGAHATILCESCHPNGRFAGTPADCYSCHQSNFTSATSPNHAAEQFSHDCSTCHSTTAWSPSTFNHASTAFPLTGAHASVDCALCHKNGQFAGTPTDCYSCHATDYTGTTDPNHAAQNFSHICSDCHTTSSWGDASFNHATTGFALTGAHSTATCLSCHVNNNFTTVPTDCYSCHQSNFTGAMSPNHTADQFSHDCTPCHSTTAWSPSTFNHATTPFPLTGAHATVDCALCHKNGQFAGTPTDCYSCHQTDFTGTTSPNHATEQFSHDCTTCHSTTAWNPSTFNHSTTIFPLTGAHATVDCALCHKNGQFAGTPTDCYSCHQTDFTGTTSPNHATEQFSHDCTTCHSTTAWNPSTFNHATTAFPLTGAHTSVDCALCHKNGQFAGTPTDCYSCHATDYARTTDPNHAAQNFSHICSDCHNTTSWGDASFNHATTGFTLTGTHTSITCISCHAGGNFTSIPSDCFSCHKSNFANALGPNHTKEQFSHDCTTCHSTTSWEPSTFNHATTPFPLTGEHAMIDCGTCHQKGQFVGTPTDCYTCHQSTFTGTMAPSHTTEQFAHDCTTCHSTSAWQPSTFDHSTTTFPLTGAHATTDCAFCHKNGQFTGLPTDCYSCHTTDFTGVADPNHVTLAFAHDCTSCHTTTAWIPATFDHSTTPFPLTGAHVNTPCASCHVKGVFAGTPTDCYSCHTADYTGTTNPAHSTSAYPHDCTQCHTTTAWTGSTFNHTSFFPIAAGSHHAPGTWTFCTDCHTDQTNSAAFSCIGCHAHNQTSMNDEHSGVSGYAYVSAKCYSCHPRGTGGG